jgi:hypothetical protein
MPHQSWKHTCPKTGSTSWSGNPVCRTCGEPGEYDGWRRGMHEAMAVYQTFYRLKPLGRHRRMADDLFTPMRATCEACKGQGLRDVFEGAAWRFAMPVAASVRSSRCLATRSRHSVSACR